MLCKNNLFCRKTYIIDIAALMKLVGEGGAEDLGNNLSDITNLLNLDFD